MSQSVLTNLDLNQNQIENAAVHNLSEAPTNPVKGQQYFNTVDNVLYYYDGTNWVSGDSITIDSALSTTSENPVQNKVITTNMVKGVTGSNATVTVTKGDNTTTTFTINNVDNSTTAGKVEATVAAGSDLDIVRATVASSDYARVRVGGAAEAGYLEVATADDGKEPIYVRQYTGNFATVKRTATLLDASGNTTFPGTVAASGFTGYVNGDNYINWGGPNLSSNMSPSDAGCLDENGHNKAAFFGGKITVEYSTDGGTTWTTPKVLTDEEKFRLTTKGGYNVKIGNVTTSGVITSENVTNYLSRITLSSRNASGDIAFYTAMKKLILDVSTNGATGTTVKVETRNIAAYNAGNDTWSTIGSYRVSGWSGYNSIPCVITFGGSSSQTGQIADLRLTMSATGASTTSSNNFNVTGIRIIGVTNWGVNAFAYTGHIYDFDYQKNVTFPAKVTARSGFEGNLTGSVTFPNHTWNLVGDDVYIGDCDVSGCLGVKGKNAATGIVFKPYSGSTDQKISINGSGTMTITGTVASTFRGNLTGNVTGTSGKLDEADTRSDNQLPSWYMSTHPRSIVTEFKDLSTLGISGSGTFGQLQTYTAWTDQSGGLPSQIVICSANDKIYKRRATADDTWGAWKTIAFTDSTVSRATADADGNTISSTYLKTANYYPAQTGSFTTSNWTSSNGKYTYTISLTKASPSANIVLYDSNNNQVFPEDVTLTKSSGNVTAITLTVGSDPDCRFAGTYNITF